MDFNEETWPPRMGDLANLYKSHPHICHQGLMMAELVPWPVNVVLRSTPAHCHSQT
jgi:hypothetical protein